MPENTPTVPTVLESGAVAPAGDTAEALTDDALTDDTLVEDVSIDGMCGVY